MAVITMLYAFTINAPAGQDIRETEKPVDHVSTQKELCMPLIGNIHIIYIFYKEIHC